MQAPPETQIRDRIAQALDDLGYEIVRVRLSGNARPVLQVMLECADERPVTVEDCARASKAVSALLEEDDPLPGAWQLEVSSPGIDRPLTRLRDFARFAGHGVKLELERAPEGQRQRRFRGRLIGIDGDTVRIALEGEVMALPFTDIKQASLVPQPDAPDADADADADADERIPETSPPQTTS